MKEKNIKLNLLKGIACLAVVCIHVLFPGKAGLIIKYIARFAVPVFLMITGYYAFGASSETIRRRFFKILKIMAYAYAVFFVYGAVMALKDHELGAWLAENYNWKTPIKYIVFCTIDFAVPLWYLIALLETYLVWMLVVKKKCESFMVKLIPVFFVLQIAWVTYCESMDIAWYLKVNFITSAMVWFLLGYYMHTPEAQKLRDLDSRILAILAVAGCAITVIPTAFELAIQFNVIGYIPYSFALFTLALKNPGRSVCRPLEYLGEKLLLNVYILHVPVSGVILWGAAHILKVNTDSIVFLWLYPILTMIGAILLSWIIELILHGRRTRPSEAQKE